MSGVDSTPPISVNYEKLSLQSVFAYNRYKDLLTKSYDHIRNQKLEARAIIMLIAGSIFMEFVDYCTQANPIIPTLKDTKSWQNEKQETEEKREQNLRKAKAWLNSAVKIAKVVMLVYALGKFMEMIIIKDTKILTEIYDGVNHVAMTSNLLSKQ